MVAIVTKDKIISYLKQHKKARVENLRLAFGVSRQLLHRHLREFVNQGVVIKVGTDPRVFYELKDAHP